IVIDPFSTKPVVITGSHNLGPKASSKNDENLVIVRHHPAMARSYAVNIMSIYNQYRWRFHCLQSKQATEYSGLHDDDRWQHGYLEGMKRREKEIWGGGWGEGEGASGGGGAHHGLLRRPADHRRQDSVQRAQHIPVHQGHAGCARGHTGGVAGDLLPAPFELSRSAAQAVVKDGGGRTGIAELHL